MYFSLVMKLAHISLKEPYYRINIFLVMSLTRIIHQPENLIKKRFGVLDDAQSNRIPGSLRSENKRIRLFWACTNRCHGRYQAQFTLVAPLGRQPTLRT